MNAKHCMLYNKEFLITILPNKALIPSTGDGQVLTRVPHDV